MKYTMMDFHKDVRTITDDILKSGKRYHEIRPIPQGGVPFAISLKERLSAAGMPVKLGEPIHPSDTTSLCTEGSNRTLIVDDLVDSGKTILPFIHLGLDTAVLGIKNTEILDVKIANSAVYDYSLYWGRKLPLEWIHFWWERETTSGTPVNVEENITRLLEFIGENPTRDGLLETPSRVIRSYGQLFGGYKKDPADIFKVFDDPADEMVLMKDIAFTSTCEHHMLPFHGIAHIAYIPGNSNKVIGASKLIRLLEVFSQRLQIQERIGMQVTQALEKYLQPKGAACIIQAVHECIRCRGVRNQTSSFITSSLTGVFKETNNNARLEILSFINGGK